ncbi:hypothetical protein H5410_002779 [Solanum commersonii]|uniref:Uncharacterized protein n=1 Tax=Solanum commersonii TaxID=4109 RepID=A0A9J6B2V9_SOLCO|nr:hypothetical protein H5410_002779 [Solanum commersonii]
MNQSTILKKKGLNPNKDQSPLKNLDVDMQYRSRAELANKFKIKREQLANEHNDRAKKEKEQIPHKIKNYEDFIPQHGKSKFLGHKSVIQSSSREELRTSHMIAGKGQIEKGVTILVHVTGTTLGNGEVQADIQDQLNFKQVKRKSVRPATGIDLFLDKEQIHNEHDIHDTIINEHNKGLDDLVDQEELGGHECDVKEEIDIDCSTKEISKSKNVQGQTTCKDIHARNLEERKDVAFDKGQAVGPTIKIVSQLRNFIGTIARNSRFISLMYTTWHAVPKDTKKCMWEFINSKFLNAVEGKKWVMTGLRDAWSTLEDMLAKRLNGIPDNQFRGRSSMETQFIQTKDNNEEPSKHEMFITASLQDGKRKSGTSCNSIARRYQIFVDVTELLLGKVVELQSHQNCGETADDAFRAISDNNVGSNLSSLIDASSSQPVRVTNLPHSSGSAHDLVLQKGLVDPLLCFTGKSNKI